ncbi:MAG: succinylglutamate desuccinylase/aspartoacylase family protein [Bacteroidota bacterium]
MGIEKENRTLVLNENPIAPGENKQVQIKISRLPMGTLIDIPVHVFNSKKSGPTVLVQAGLHGDEINGVETLRQMLEGDMFHLKRGTVIVVPILNVFGFIHFSRDVPDGKDVNRSFPGSKAGSLASRIAHSYTSKILPHVDFAIDLHTGGAQRNNYPQIRFTEDDDKSRSLAETFNAPFCFASRLIAGSFRKATHKMGIPTIVYEGGESMRFDENAIRAGVEGICNVLAAHKMITKEQRPKKKQSVYLETRRWIRASRAGMFIPLATNGSKIEKGQELGVIADTFAKRNKTIKAPFDGYIFCLNHQAVVNQGDALFHIGK